MSEQKRESVGVVKCGHCGNRTPMDIVATYSYERPDPEWSRSDNYQLLACPVCNAVTLRSFYWHDGYSDPEDVTFTTLYPSRSRALPGLPPSIQKAYEAAVNVKHIDANAYGVLIGRVLEIVCEDRGAKGKSLNEKLGDLASRGEIPGKLVDVAHGLRDLRNVGAHPALGELTEAEVPILDDLCQAILAYVYNAPFLAEQAAERLESLKKKRKKQTKGGSQT